MNSFGKKIFNCVNNIPKGKVISYGQAAVVRGKPNGAREVGRILHNKRSIKAKRHGGGL